MPNGDFFIPLQCRFHAGAVCPKRVGLADILFYYRRLSTLCSDELKLRNFQISDKNIATLDVLQGCFVACLLETQYIASP